MFENIGSFFKKIMKNEQKELLVESTPSKDAAKERLHVVLMQDRANVSADFLELMKEEIIDVIKKYIVVDESQIDVRLTNQENDDGSIGAPSLYANIPILNIRNDIKCEVLKDGEPVNKEISEVIEENNNDRTQVLQIIKDIDIQEYSTINYENRKKDSANIEKETEESKIEKTATIKENLPNEEDKASNEVIEGNKNDTSNDEKISIESNLEKTKIEECESKNKKDNDSIENSNGGLKTKEENNIPTENQENDIEENKDEQVDNKNEIITDINELNEAVDEEEDDDVTFDDLLKAAEEEERLKKLEEEKNKNSESLKSETKTTKKTSKSNSKKRKSKPKSSKK